MHVGKQGEQSSIIDSQYSSLLSPSFCSFRTAPSHQPFPSSFVVAVLPLMSIKLSPELGTVFLNSSGPALPLIHSHTICRFGNLAIKPSISSMATSESEIDCSVPRFLSSVSSSFPVIFLQFCCNLSSFRKLSSNSQKYYSSLQWPLQSRRLIVRCLISRHQFRPSFQ